MDLIIVESPTKAKTISKFLDKGYKIESSFGHIRDLPKSKMGIDIENNFTPQYTIPAKAKKTVTNLKKWAEKADSVILASDEDREGEAISWHLIQALKLSPDKTQRIAFHEITKEAILEAIANPKKLDQNLVDAQQARRVLDRLVGYELSPFLWKKVAKGLSAGRVQSVATRLIVEREREIKAFKSDEYWTLSAELSDEEKKNNFNADLYKINGKRFKKLDLTKEKVETVKHDLEGCHYKVDTIEKRDVTKSPSAPFTTSTLQQAANRMLGFSAKQTMMIAQKLYEQGYITYMRTDSLNLSVKFLNESQAWLKDTLGKEYSLEKSRHFKSRSKNAQEAHEAIRPTEVGNTPDSLDGKLDNNQRRLYRLIWQRAVASQMPLAKLAATSINVKASNDKAEYILRASGQILMFPGYLQIYPEKTKEQELPALTEKQPLALIKLQGEQHFTNPPARYSDAGLVKELEKHGIGRPSTYAPTIATIIARNYIERDEKKKLKPTDIAFVVIDLLINHFSKIVDYTFTAQLENDLDLIAEGKKKWPPVINDFYSEFHDNLEKKYQEIQKSEIMPEEKSDEKCDKCGANMVIKTGRYGKFLACSAYPDCKNIKGMEKTGPDGKAVVSEEIKELQEKYKGTVCEKCGSDMAVKSGKYGPFLGCTGYPKCKNIKNVTAKGEKELDVDCPLCGKGKIVKKFSRRGAFYACNAYPDCKNAYWGKPTGEKCPDCESLMITDKEGQAVCSNKGCQS